MVETRDFRVVRWAAAERLLEATLEASSPYFEGHFPGRPVFPGVGQIALLETLLQRLHGDVAIEALERLRFLAPVLSGDRIALQLLEKPGPHRAGFEILRGAERVTEGVVSWGPRVRA